MTITTTPETLEATREERTLDPADWDALRKLGHRMVDDMLDHLRTLRQRPTWQPMPSDVRASFDEPLPWKGQGAPGVYEDFRRTILPYTNGNIHPRFWGWVMGSGTPVGMLADMLAAGLNPNVGGFDQAPAQVEHEVVRWLAELMGLPRDASGVLVEGGTLANVLGLAVGRHVAARAAGWNVREHGLQGPDRPRLLVYGSVETHSWARRALELFGLGSSAFRPIAVNAHDEIEIAALRHAIARDRAAGHVPACVIGTAGTVNTGATDDLSELAALCETERVWFHVDGAFGAMLRLSDSLRPIVAGIERADSIGFDLHKWGSIPYGTACVLVRDAATHHETFAATASYLAPATRGVMAGGIPFSDRGVDLSRGFRALKVWMTLKAHGLAAIAAMIEQNVAQARYLGSLVEAHPELELLAPVALNIVCFRFAPQTVPAAALDDINREILLRVQEQGIAVPSGTVVRGRYAIRVANVNHRSRRDDFEELARAVVRLGHEIGTA